MKIIPAIFGLILSVALVLYLRHWAPLNDIINGTLESCGGLFIFMSVKALHKVKAVAGVSWKHAAFFTVWGLWNLAYYPSLDQWFSFTGGVFLVAVNAFWLGQIFYYPSIKEKLANVRV